MLVISSLSIGFVTLMGQRYKKNYTAASFLIEIYKNITYFGSSLNKSLKSPLFKGDTKDDRLRDFSDKLLKFV